MENIIELKNISKTYYQGKKEIAALKDFSISVPKNGFVSVMGPSGCGKSTVTKIMAGIENIQEGQVTIDQQDHSNGIPREVKKRIGYVFQWHNLAEWRTVEKNLFFPLELFGCKKDSDWMRRSEKYLSLVGLLEYRNIYPHELSGGMKQRVGIARALMMEPDILILDQPFGALDAITRKTIAALISKLVWDEGKTVVMVTSNVDEAIQYSDQICIMNAEGRTDSVINVDLLQEDREVPDFWLLEKNLSLKKDVINVLNKNKTSEIRQEGLLTAVKGNFTNEAIH